MTDTAATSTTTIASPTETTTVTESVKPGYKTTEFWLALAATLLSALYASGALTNSTALAIAGIAATVLTALGYKVTRTLVKTAGVVAVVLLGLAVTQPACDTGRARAANAGQALIDCTAPERAAVVHDLGVTLTAWVLKHVAGDGRTIDLAQLKRDALTLKDSAVGSCALATALALLATPPSGQGLLAPTGPTAGEWGEAFAEVRAELRIGAIAVPADAAVR